MYKFHKKAFTLAELLIAMAIFGFIAVTLVPNVTNNAERALFTTQLKKVQNDVQQAILLIVTKNQGSLAFACGDPTAAEENFNQVNAKATTHTCFRNKIAADLDIFTIFGTNTLHQSVKEYQYATNRDVAAGEHRKKMADPGVQTTAYKARTPRFLNKRLASFDVNNKDGFEAVNLKNGAMVSVYFDPNRSTADIVSSVTGDAALVDYGTGINTTICGYLEIDVNASKAPNVVGKDIHYFWIVDKDGLVPFGEIDNFTCGVVAGSKFTRPEKSTDIKANLGCTYRLMSRGKIDYY